ncbi:G-protein coupled receptor 55a [Aplochiton taeniatus]
MLDASMMTFSTVYLVQLIVYIPTILLGLPLNLAALWLILLRIRRRTESTVYLANLIINDSLLILSLPFKLYAYNNNWELGGVFCSFLESLVFVNIYGSIVLIVCISRDRFISMQFPFKSSSVRSPWKATIGSLVLWLFVFLLAMPVYRLHTPTGTPTNTTTTTCFRGFSNSTWDQLWIIITMETVFSVCTVAMVFFSVRVIQILRSLRRRNPLDEKLRDHKSVKIVLTNLVAFLVCFIPYHTVAPIYFLKKRSNETEVVINSLREVVHITSCLSSVNCLLDGMCYYLILKENLDMAREERQRLSTRRNLPNNHIDQHQLTGIKHLAKEVLS